VFTATAVDDYFFCFCYDRVDTVVANRARIGCLTKEKLRIR
jgi:hypothetical protein